MNKKFMSIFKVVISIFICEFFTLPGSVNAEVVLTGPGGLRFDIQDTGGGELLDGTSDAYDGAYTLSVNGIAYSSGGVPGTLILSGRGVEMAPQTNGNLIVRREAWVPAGGLYDYIRYYDSIENTSSTDVNITVTYQANLGSDSSTQITATSSGDLLVDIFDRWFCTDDGAGGDPSLGHVWYGESASVVPSVETCTTTFSNNIDVQFNVDVPAGGKVAFVIFGIQVRDSVTAQQAAQWLSEFPVEAQEGLEFDKLYDIVNWGVSGAPRIRFTESDYEIEEGGSLEISVEVSDPEGDPVTVTWDIDGDNVYDDWEGLSTIVSGVGIDGPATIEVGVRATDGVNERIRRIPVTVLNVPPVFVSDPAVAPGTSLHRGEQWEYQIVVEDQANKDMPPDSPLDRLTVTVPEKPQGMIFSAGLVLSWNVPRTSDVVGAHPVKIQCTDGDGGTAVQEFVLTVLENTPPGKPTIISPKEETVATLRPQLRIGNAVDNENDQLYYIFDVATLGTFSPSSIVEHAVIPENPSGETTYTVSKDLEDGRRYFWKVKAKDDMDEGPSVSTFFQIDLSKASSDADALDAPRDITEEEPGTVEPAEACSCSLIGTKEKEKYDLLYEIILFVNILIFALVFGRRRK